MLYIWPFIVFFSAPLFTSRLVNIVSFLLSEKKETKSREEVQPAASSHLTQRIFKQKLYYPFLLFGIVVAFGLIVKYNTIIHPFTLADNRHYMFYVFKLTIRRSGMVRYALVAPYVLCLWLSLGALSSNGRVVRTNLQPYINHLVVQPDAKGGIQAGPQAPRKTSGKDEDAIDGMMTLDNAASSAHESVPVSTAILLILTTALSLITAPLVEPRYFILPWVMWRLLVPGWQAVPSPTPGVRPGRDGQSSRVWAILYKHDVRLFLETAWFIVINLVTGYVFLMWPYQWRAADGTLLDEGRLQRFMW